MVSASSYVGGRAVNCETIPEEFLYYTDNAENHFLPDVVKGSLNEDSTQISTSVEVQLKTIDVDQLSSSKSLKKQTCSSINHMKMPLKKVDKGKKYSCIFCNKSYKHRQSLFGHNKKHKDIDAGRVTCNICGKSLVNQRSLVIHMRIHTGEKPYKCDICKQRFAQSEHLKSHVRTHTGDKPFQCKVCEKIYRTSGHLNLHMKVHSRKRSYVCRFCDKSYIHHANLKQHESTHFIRFHCSECKSSFTRKESLNGHMQRKHMLRFKAYSCNVCDKSFCFKPDLQTHVKRHYNKLVHDEVF